MTDELAPNEVATKPKRGRKPKPPAAPRKPREKKRYEVQSGVEANGLVTWAAEQQVEDTATGLAWIAENGEDGSRYRVVTVQAEVTVKVETRQVRTLE